MTNIHGKQLKYRGKTHRIAPLNHPKYLFNLICSQLTPQRERERETTDFHVSSPFLHCLPPQKLLEGEDLRQAS